MPLQPCSPYSDLPSFLSEGCAGLRNAMKRIVSEAVLKA